MTDTATQLAIYNKALRWLEERKLVSLSENRESLRYLNDEYSDAVLYVLSQANWKHALRFIQANAEIGQTPNFSFEFAFLKPADWVSTFQVSENEAFDPLMRYFEDMNNYWYANVNLIYVKYISSDPRFGWNTGLWTPGFKEYLAGYLAQLLAPRIKQAQDKIERIDKLVKRLKLDAQAKDAFGDPPQATSLNSWVLSRAPRGSMYPVGGFGNDD